MIHLYTGTPGSGKSLHVARDVIYKINFRKQNVIANFPVKDKYLYKSSKHGKFIYCDNEDLTVKYLVLYARENHKYGKEGQTMLVIDECQVILGNRDYARKDRPLWLKFLQHHRKLGYNIVLVTQHDKLIDKQVRAQVEYEYKHRKVNNYKIGMLFPIPMFCCVEYWYGVKEKLSTSFFVYRKKLGLLYDSFKIFDNELIFKELGVVPDVGEGPDLSGGAPVRPA